MIKLHPFVVCQLLISTVEEKTKLNFRSMN
jgi:hypothetical protein